MKPAVPVTKIVRIWFFPGLLMRARFTPSRIEKSRRKVAVQCGGATWR
jgi:hypothetical protein